MHATTATLAPHSSQRSTGLTRRIHHGSFGILLASLLVIFSTTSGFAQSEKDVRQAGTEVCTVHVGDFGFATDPDCGYAVTEASGWPDFDSSSLGDHARRVDRADSTIADTAIDEPAITGVAPADMPTTSMDRAYSPEAEAANPELAELGMDRASTEKEVASSGWYVIVGEGGRAYSPEAEAAGWPDYDPSSLAEIDGETHIAVDDEPGS